MRKTAVATTQTVTTNPSLRSLLRIRRLNIRQPPSGLPTRKSYRVTTHMARTSLAGPSSRQLTAKPIYSRVQLPK